MEPAGDAMTDPLMDFLVKLDSVEKASAEREAAGFAVVTLDVESQHRLGSAYGLHATPEEALAAAARYADETTDDGWEHHVVPLYLDRHARQLEAVYHAEGRWWSIQGRECEITIEARPHYCDRGNWIAKLHPRGELALSIDGHDAWPRYFFDFDRMLLELRAWLIKRGQLA